MDVRTMSACFSKDPDIPQMQIKQLLKMRIVNERVFYLLLFLTNMILFNKRVEPMVFGD